MRTLLHVNKTYQLFPLERIKYNNLSNYNNKNCVTCG